MNTNQKNGEELNQLSRLLFNKASDNWYIAIVIEITAGLAGVGVALSKLTDESNTLLAILGFILLFIAYTLRFSFYDTYDDAETMRRQSVLSEGLNWPLNQTQFSEWRLKAGKKILDNFELKPRDKDYYATQKPPGPQRLLDMTVESAFWTRHLYSKIRTWVWIIFAITIFVFIIALSVAPLAFVPASTSLKIVYSVYLLLPLILSIDIFGWALKLGKLATAIKEIEADLERLSESSDVNESQVLRLVSEYNCQVVSGFPIPNWFFSKKHDEIAALWAKRNSKQ